MMHLSLRSMKLFSYKVSVTMSLYIAEVLSPVFDNVPLNYVNNIKRGTPTVEKSGEQKE